LPHQDLHAKIATVYITFVLFDDFIISFQVIVSFL
jgi:hypothetical protein